MNIHPCDHHGPRASLTARRSGTEQHWSQSCEMLLKAPICPRLDVPHGDILEWNGVNFQRKESSHVFSFPKARRWRGLHCEALTELIFCQCWTMLCWTRPHLQAFSFSPRYDGIYRTHLITICSAVWSLHLILTDSSVVHHGTKEKENLFRKWINNVT